MRAASAKACFGHTEGTAGVQGALLAALALQQHSMPPVMHLRGINAYVASALDECSGAHHNMLPMVPREGLAWPGAQTNLAGCSSFGMSGINAHALFSSPHPQQLCQSTVLTWQQHHHWPMPVHHHMLVSSFWNRDAAVAR